MSIKLQPFSKTIDLNHRNDPWIIMVHGFSHNHKYFEAQVAEFQKDYRIFLTDLRGHGDSTQVGGPYGVEEYADDLQSVINKVGIQKAHYWGTHTGSAIGLVLALRQPVLFSSLILEGTFLPGFPMPRVGELLNNARNIAHKNSLDEALKDWFAHADWFDYANEHPKECRRDEFRALTFEFSGLPWLSELTPRPVTQVADNLRLIRQPVLFYNGEYDLTDFQKAAKKLEEGLPNGQGAVIKHAGGFPGWENPMEVNRLVRQFLTDQGPNQF